MTRFGSVYLLKGKEFPVLQKHHWIYSGGIDKKRNVQDGDVVEILDHRGKLLGYGYYNSKTTISVRILSFDATNPFDAIHNNIEKAITLREKLFANSQDTNAYRLINGEGDGIPGLIVDKY